MNNQDPLILLNEPTAPKKHRRPKPVPKTRWELFVKCLVIYLVLVIIIWSVWWLVIKYLHGQIEVVDKKVDNLVGDLKDFRKNIEEKSVEIETRLQKLVERNEVLEAALDDLKGGSAVVDDLKSMDLLTGDGLAKLGKRKGSGDVEMSLDEIRELTRAIVEKEIAKHAADGLGMADYALASANAMVVKHSEAMRNNSHGVHNTAEKMLMPSFGEPGQCFSLKGSSGFVHISLRTTIVPEAITLEHVSKSVAFNRSTAPQHCRVSGWLEGEEGLETELDMHLLTAFTYDLDKSNVQTFKVSESVRSVGIDTVKFEFTSNHGNPSYTCIYRLRVHGHQPPMIGSDS